MSIVDDDRYCEDDPDAGTPPPSDLAAEAAVLAAVMVSAEAISAVRDVLVAKHFYSEAHRQVYIAALAVHDSGEHPDHLAIVDRLRATNRLQQVGGAAAIVRLADASPAIHRVKQHARIVRDLWAQREAIAITRRKLAELSLGRVSATDAGAELARAFAEIAPQGSDAAAIATFNVAEIMAPLPPIEWRVQALKLSPGAAAAMAGRGFVGKTITAQSIGASCASGRPVFGVFHVAPCRVLHLDFEQGKRLTFDRYQRLARGMGIDPRELGDRLHVAIHPTVYLDGSGADDLLARAFEGYGLVIIDSLRAAAPSVDENSSEVRRCIDVLSRASEKTGALPILIHHARKPNEQAKGGAMMSIRGSSSIFDACASVFVLEADKGEPTRVRHEKERITGVPLEDFLIRVEDVAIDGDPRAGLRVVHMETEQAPAPTTRAGDKFEQLKNRVLDVVRGNPGVLTSRNEICARVTGGGKDAKLEAIKDLLRLGRLTQRGGEGGSYEAV